jgi:hypothetical protein
MIYEFELTNQPRATWDLEILGFEFPEIFQTSIYGEFIEYTGKTPGYISIYKDGGLIGNCLIETSNERIATWAYGPLINSNFVLDQEKIIRELFSFLKTRGVIAIENAKTRKYFDPLITFNENSDLYSRIGGSPYIDMQPGSEEIMNSFDRSVRKNINKCVRAGAEVIFSEDTTLLEPYTEMLGWFRSSRDFGLPLLHPNSDTLKIFNTSLSTMGLALVKLGDKFLAGIGYVTFGKMMVGIAMAPSKENLVAKLPVNDFLFVKAVEHYKQRGIRILDLAGGEKNPVDPKKFNIVLYKQQFTSKSASYGMIDRKILSNTWYVNAIKRKIKYILSK